MCACACVRVCVCVCVCVCDEYGVYMGYVYNNASVFLHMYMLCEYSVRNKSLQVVQAQCVCVCVSCVCA